MTKTGGRHVAPRRLTADEQFTGCTVRDAALMVLLMVSMNLPMFENVSSTISSSSVASDARLLHSWKFYYLGSAASWRAFSDRNWCAICTGTVGRGNQSHTDVLSVYVWCRWICQCLKIFLRRSRPLQLRPTHNCCSPENLIKKYEFSNFKCDYFNWFTYIFK